MSDDRRVDELSLDELEEIVEERRRIERARQFAHSNPDARFRPLTVAPVEPAPKRRRRVRPRNWRDAVLLAVEIAAVLGLIAIIVNSLGALQTLNSAVVQAQQAVVAPTAQATTGAQGELPGASFPPANASQNELPGSSFPPEALPVALGVNVESVPALPPPTPGPQSPTRIVIKKLGIDWPIVEGDSWDELQRGVGHHVGSANPGERGNMVLSGHDDVFGEVFREIDQLKNGDEIVVYSGGHAFRYAVRAQRVVSPSELSVLTPTREPIVTLITCTPYRVDSMRLVVIGQLVP
ncbi:MAG: sortase [Anaerolineae bacterium]